MTEMIGRKDSVKESTPRQRTTALSLMERVQKLSTMGTPIKTTLPTRELIDISQVMISNMLKGAKWGSHSNLLELRVPETSHI